MSKGGSKSSSAPPYSVLNNWVQNLEDVRTVAGDMWQRPIADAHHNHNTANRALLANAAGPGVQNVGNAAGMSGNLGLMAALGNYDPMMIQGVTADMDRIANAGDAGDAAQFGGASMDRHDIRNVHAGMLPQLNRDAYMNPYTDHVIDRSLQDLDRARAVAMQGIGDQAAAAGAFGNSRHGVVEGEAHRGFADAAAGTAANLRHLGFDTSSQLMQQDLARQMQAHLANQAMDAQTAAMNAQLAQQTGLANTGAQNQMAQFNAEMAQSNAGNINDMLRFNASQLQQANTANQGAHLSGMGMGLQGMNLGLTGAQQMGNLGSTQFGMGQDSAQSIANMGDFFRSIDQGRTDAHWMLPQLQRQMINDALGLGMGMTTSSSTQRPDLFGQMIGAGGAVLGGMAEGGTGWFK